MLMHEALRKKNSNVESPLMDMLMLKGNQTNEIFISNSIQKYCILNYAILTMTAISMATISKHVNRV
jgi:hypothetical protein